MRPSEILLQKKESIEAILAKYALVNPRVFGSVARHTDDEESDLDLLVSKEAEGFFWYSPLAASSFLEEKLGIPIQILVEGHNDEDFLRKIRNTSIPLSEFV